MISSGVLPEAEQSRFPPVYRAIDTALSPFAYPHSVAFESHFISRSTSSFSATTMR